MKKANQMRAGLESLACIAPECELYGQPGQANLTVRKVYGKDGIRYLRCRRCQCEFSERKNTGLWNTKIAETKAIAVAEHLADGCSLKGIARLVKVDASTVRRLNQRIGAHGAAFHQARVQNVQVKVLEGDERHGYAGTNNNRLGQANCSIQRVSLSCRMCKAPVIRR
jgi:transposase-like protein